MALGCEEPAGRRGTHRTPLETAGASQQKQRYKPSGASSGRCKMGQGFLADSICCVRFGVVSALRFSSPVKNCTGFNEEATSPALIKRCIQKEVTRGFCQLIWRLGKCPTVINNPCVLGTDFMYQTKGLKSCCWRQSSFKKRSTSCSPNKWAFFSKGMLTADWPLDKLGELRVVWLIGTLLQLLSFHSVVSVDNPHVSLLWEWGWKQVLMWLWGDRTEKGATQGLRP